MLMPWRAVSAQVELLTMHFAAVLLPDSFMPLPAAKLI